MTKNSSSGRFPGGDGRAGDSDHPNASRFSDGSDGSDRPVPLTSSPSSPVFAADYEAMASLSGAAGSSGASAEHPFEMLFPEPFKRLVALMRGRPLPMVPPAEDDPLYGSAYWKSVRRALSELEALGATGDGCACFCLGLAARQGLGVVMDEDAAVTWFKAAADLGFVPAMIELAGCFEDDPERALALQEEAGMAGAPEAAFNAGLMHLHGHGTPVDEARAKRWFVKAAELGDVDGCLVAGFFNLYGRGGPVDLGEARRWFLRAAEEANPLAAFTLATILAGDYDNDDSDDPDDDLDAEARGDAGEDADDEAEVRTALRWFERAVYLGHPRAAVRLGAIHFQGILGRKDPVAAHHYLSLALDLDESAVDEAMTAPGVDYPLHPGRSYQYLFVLEPKERKDARLVLGCLLLEGVGADVEHDPERAADLLEASAAGDSAMQKECARVLIGDAQARSVDAPAGGDGRPELPGDVRHEYEAALRLALAAAGHQVEGAAGLVGLVYLAGVSGGQPGVDEEEGWRWIRRGAEEGDDRMAFAMGVACEEGRFGPEGLAGAADWYRRALGHPEAHYRLGSLYERGVGVERSFVKAYAAYCEAARLGSAEGANNAAACLMRGCGVRRNPAEALRHYQFAAAKGCAEALYNLGCALLSGTGCEKDPLGALDCFMKAGEEVPLAFKKAARIYEVGKGVGVNKKRAADLYRRAVELGCEEARKGLDRVSGRKTSD